MVESKGDETAGGENNGLETPSPRDGDTKEKLDVAAEPPFSIFTSRQKMFIVTMASLAALFSPLSANIYYPALDTLAEELSVTYTLINLTVTSYLVR
jgi:hypothetical protein